MNRITVIIVIIIIAIAVVISSLGFVTVQKLQGSFLGIISPFQKAGDAVQKQVGGIGKGLKSLQELEEENARLITENTELRAKIQILGDLSTENNKLRDALEYKRKSAFKLVPARVISRDASTWWSTVKINRGFEDGIEADQPVLTDMGLVGKTTTVGKNESIVLLISDETCKVAARVEGTNEKGILSGQRVSETAGPGQLELNFLRKKADLQAGQKVFVEGSGGVFPYGIFLGTVVSFKARALDGQAIVEPALDLSSVEDVFVVVGAQ